MAQYSKNSPYSNTAVNSWFLGYYKHRSIPKAPDDIIIRLENKYEGRPDRLANDFLGDARFWWVIMVRNMDKVRDPIADLRTGMILYLPRKERLNQLLG